MKKISNEFINLIKDAKAKGNVEQHFICKYCNKSFARESTLGAHLCENKRRDQQRDEVGVRIGYQAWLRFFELTQGSATKKTYDDFAKSQFYLAFIKFGRHLHSIRVIDSQMFVDWVIKQNKKIDDWCKDKTYSEYLLQYLRKENPQNALERSIKEMQIWADENNEHITNFFKKSSSSRLVHMLLNGRISPWIIYSCETGIAALSEMNEEQIKIVYEWIEPDFWNKKLKDYLAEAEWVKHILTTSGF